MRASGTPSARARAREHAITAAPWSTSSTAFMYFVYGKATMRFAGVGVAISSALRRIGNQAWGFAAATSVIGASSAPSRRRCSSRLQPRRARQAFSNSG